MPTAATDTELVAGHLAGDPDALAGIYDRYADTLYDTAAAMLGDRNDAADVLQDTILLAAERLGQLRDPARLKPWLFAILRNEVYRRSKRRRRTVATDFSGGEDGFDVTDERADTAGTATETVAGEELAALLRGAAAGLDERDQLVLELSVRQGLEGQDLADALGVSANQSYTLVHRMRERVERSLGAYAVARAGRSECDDLASILRHWDGEFTVLIRKRVARHVDACGICGDRRGRIAPLALIAGAPVLAAPAELRDRVLQKAAAVVPAPGPGFDAPGGFPSPLRAARRIAAWIGPTAAASIVVVAAVLGVRWWSSGGDESIQSAASDVTTTSVTAGATTTDPPSITTSTAPSTSAPAPVAAVDTTMPTTTTAPTTTATTVTTVAAPTTTALPQPAPPPPAPPAPTTAPPTTVGPTTTTVPGRIDLDATVIDLGTAGQAATFGLTNAGDAPVTFAASTPAAPFAIAPGSGTLQPGQTAVLTASVDRAAAPEGDASTTVTVTGDGRSQSVELRASVRRAPVIGTVDGPVSDCATFGASQQLFIGIDVAASDETPPLTARFTVNGPLGQTSTITLQPSGSTLTGAHVIDVVSSTEVAGPWTWSVTVGDAFGSTTSTGGTHTVAC